MYEIEKMIADGEAKLLAEEQEYAESKRKLNDGVQALRDSVFEQVRQLLPDAARHYLDTGGEYLPSVNLINEWNEGKVTNIWQAEESHQLCLNAPECAPILFIAVIGKEHSFIRYYNVPTARLDREAVQAYFSGAYSEDRIEDLDIALALAAREYKKYQDIKEQCERIKEKSAQREVEAAKEVYSQIEYDFYSMAINAYRNIKAPGSKDFQEVIALALIGILDQMKQGTVLSNLDEIESSVRIWGRIGLGENEGTSK